MIDLSFVEIGKRINNLVLPKFDMIIGIANGGVVPASLIAYKLGIELQIIRINFRDEENHPLYEYPIFIEEKPIMYQNKKILVVDDVSVSGKTLGIAIKILFGNELKTLVMKGKADYVIFPEISECVNWPWKTPLNKVK